MAYTFVQQSEISFATGQSSLTLPSFTATAGNLLVVVSTAHTGSTLVYTDGVNTYNAIVAANQGTDSLYLAVAQNIAAGSTSLAITGDVTQQGGYIAEYSGLALASAVENSNAAFQAGPGSGANVVSSGNVNVTAQPALLFSFSWNQTGGANPVLTAGTSPTAFTGRTAVWSTLNGGGNAVGVPEDARILATGNVAATFGASGNTQFANVLTVAVALSEVIAAVTASIAWTV